MSDTCSNLAEDDSYDVIMETKCPAKTMKCKWIVKDFTKYPSEEVCSALFETTEIGACEFTLRNVTCNDADIIPEFIAKFYSKVEEDVYTTLKVCFCDNSGEEFYRMAKKMAFTSPKNHYFPMKTFPQEKIWGLPEDTLMVECELEILRQEQVLIKPDDEKSESPETTTSEDIKSQSLKVSPAEDIKSQSLKVSPAEDIKSQSLKVSPPQGKESEPSKVSPAENQQRLSSMILSRPA